MFVTATAPNKPYNLTTSPVYTLIVQLGLWVGKTSPMPGSGKKKVTKTESKSKGGRPTLYSSEVIGKICELTATTSRSLKSICKDAGVNERTVLEWLADSNKAEFTQKYARAKEMQADVLAAEILEISDDQSKDIIAGEYGESGNSAAVNRSKLRVDSRKWLASKLAPKKYGDKIEHTGNVEVAVVTGMKIV